ncbi:hypothetical protein O0I10_005479 [Lichtheimia ornata]|uniref:Glycosyltransferase family 62 protein n=1 Tax=Lichtheimia ornata TaxID=688661 RepID=A0AAD7V519_9FUNG|nr:uncharacterized protein O0I10_005479 [Lichtheimia ornata]KAJ8658753.1 hypothetical protein O0I10_005479 [Lichtheimia ornata]
MISLLNLRGGRRLIIISTLLTALFIYLVSTVSLQTTSNTSCDPNTRSLYQRDGAKVTDEHEHDTYYLNLNDLNSTTDAVSQNEHLLVLTPLLHTPLDKQQLEHFFNQLDRTTFPNQLISIALLVTDDSDTLLLETLETVVRKWRQRWLNRFHEISVYQRNFELATTAGSSSNANRPYVRSMMARARNFLLSAALRDYHSWVAWVDVDVVEYPPTIFEDLMSADGDVVVPNCLLYREDYAFWGYDRNNWAESDYSLQMQQWMPQDTILMEGYNDFSSGRSLLVDMPTHLGEDYKVPLDGVGATFTLVKSHVHREGANFPSFVYRHQVDAEAFGKVAVAMGFSVYGLPGYKIYHAERQ